MEAKKMELAQKAQLAAKEDPQLIALMQTYRDLPTYQGEYADPDIATALWATIVRGFEAKDPELGRSLRAATEAKQQKAAKGWWFWPGSRDEIIDSVLYGLGEYAKEVNMGIPANPAAKPLTQITPPASEGLEAIINKWKAGGYNAPAE